ncbi:MAG: LTA synthase family protein [Bacilli bacterium]|jgi:phosphoglycerol transferase MdoB-like AlkP superfamily enzyme|nr:LTA synthase family protein [Bacilli bacterium]
MLKKVFSKINVIYGVLAFIVFIKLICFTLLIYNEEDLIIRDTNFNINTYLLSYLFSAFSFFSIALIFNNKTSLKILIILDVILSILMYGDVLYFRGFESYLSFYSIAQYRIFGVIGSSVFALIKFSDLLIFIDPIILILLSRKLFKNIEQEENKGLIDKALMIGYVLGCYVILLNYPTIFSPKATKIETGAKLSIIGYHYYDFSLYINDAHHNVLNKNDKQAINDWFKIKNENKGIVDDFGIFKDKNIIFLQVESLENFVINKKIDNQEITPHLNRLLNNSYYFNNIIEQVNEGNSSDADFLVNTSFYPLRNGAYSMLYANTHYLSLPVILQKHNYYSTAIHSGKSYFWNKENYLPNLGFNQLIDIDGLNYKEEDLFFMGLRDEAHLTEVADLISTFNDKYYLFTVTETSHTPFKIPEDMQYLKLDEAFNKTSIGRYFQAIHYTDEAIGKFIDKLEQNNQLSNTIIIIYGDHEGLHKYNNKTILSKQYQDYDKYNNDNKIPVIIYNPSLKKQITINKIGGEVDIMPTILSLVGINKEEYQDSIMGNNLLEHNKAYVIDNYGNIKGDQLDEAMIKHLKQSFKISDKIIKSNYFNNKFIAPTSYKYNNKVINKKS